MQEGDRIIWKYTPSGGYGTVIPVAGIVRRVGPKRVRIEVACKVRGEWIRQMKTVVPEKLVPREKPVPELGESV